MPVPGFREVVDRFKPEFVAALRAKDILKANEIALRACDGLFQIDPDEARMVVWDKFYRRLNRGRKKPSSRQGDNRPPPVVRRLKPQSTTTRLRVPYQCTDFESVDYELWSAPGLKKLMRGPKPNLERTEHRYVTFLGASQFFGRHVPVAVHALVERASGLPCVNLAAPGAGPEYFDSPEILKIANAGAAVVLQVVSGKGIGCDEYPGGDMTFRKDGTRVKRLRLIEEIRDHSPAEAERLTRTWQERYVDAMKRVVRHLEVPVILVWMAARAPRDWSVEGLVKKRSVGDFPHFIDAETLERITPSCAAFVDLSRDEGLPYGFVSRFTGKPCPTIHKKDREIWTNSYYPSFWAAEQVSQGVCKALDALKIFA